MANDHRLTIAARVVGALAAMTGLTLIGVSQVTAWRTVERVEHEADLRVASQCVAGHERNEQIRDGDEAVYRRNAETLIELSHPTPEREAEYRRAVDRDVNEIRANVENPDCDLEASRRLLAAE